MQSTLQTADQHRATAPPGTEGLRPDLGPESDQGQMYSLSNQVSHYDNWAMGHQSLTHSLSHSLAFQLLSHHFCIPT